jgi:beta-ribofuranosylaminobenzene 5'-phosphate synthase
MIEIKTPARLHLGLLDTNGSMGRLYGSIGVAIEYPQILLCAEPNDSLIVDGMETERVLFFARRFLNRYPILCGAHLDLKSNIPNHVGLGSGTQLALAVGMALAKLGRLNISVAEIALAMGRGVHSGIGINTFQHGGFVLDGGHLIDRIDSHPIRQAIPPVLIRHALPANWYFVIVIPEVSAGFSGESEQDAFRNLPRSSTSQVEKISHQLLMKMLPALVEKDIIRFGEALTQIQRLVGESFAAVQGGRFGNSSSEEMIDFLLGKGAEGAGQSSWGPTVYGLVKGEAAAHLLVDQARVYLAAHGRGQVFSVRPDNHGARITFDEG